MYYRQHSEGEMGCGTLVIMLLTAFLLLFVTEFVANASTESQWNNGTCAVCEERYELKAATNGGLKYYACPECGQEVKRY